MSPGPHVFKDGRFGLWIVNPANLTDRLPKIKAFGLFTDLFLPRWATLTHLRQVRDAELFANMWWGAHEPVEQFARKVLDDIAAKRPGAGELDIEVPDAELPTYIRTAVRLIRKERPYYRLRLNTAPFKGFALPIDMLRSDENLFACQQTYYGDMSRVSEGEALLNMLEYGVPLEKASLCYGGAFPVPVQSPPEEQHRVCAVPQLWYEGRRVGRALRRGVVFQDDLLVQVGLL